MKKYVPTEQNINSPFIRPAWNEMIMHWRTGDWFLAFFFLCVNLVIIAIDIFLVGCFIFFVVILVWWLFGFIF